MYIEITHLRKLLVTHCYRVWWV